MQKFLCEVGGKYHLEPYLNSESGMPLPFFASASPRSVTTPAHFDAHID